VSEPLLRVRDLAVAFESRDGLVPIVDGVDLELEAGRTLGLVGESGCGKTTAFLALLRLLPAGLVVTGGEVRFRGRDLLALDERALRAVRGRDIGAVFQEPTAALNPVLTVGEQVAEVLRHHRGLSRRDAWAHAVRLLGDVGIAEPERRAKDHPHRLSGGMNQRVAIAAAIACEPALLCLDEPTTALDVTVQREVLALFDSVRATRGTAILFVTHDLALARHHVDRVAVMYAGRIVEEAGARELLERPAHPYTAGLARSLPQRARPRERLAAIEGSVPVVGDWPAGCRFHPRCPEADATCRAVCPPLERHPGSGRAAACHHPLVPGRPAAAGEGGGA
jgi:oligopeptide/dipeptide ABC transporter ATP-binding protein